MRAIIAESTIEMGMEELINPLRTAKWVARLYAFVSAVVMANLVLFPHCGVYDPSDFFQTTLRDIPVYALYTFLGAIGLFFFTSCFLVNSGQQIVAFVQMTKSNVLYILRVLGAPSPRYYQLNVTRAPPFPA